MAASSLQSRSFSIARLVASRSAQISQARSFSSDALAEYKPGEIGAVSGIPDEHLKRRVNQSPSWCFLFLAFKKFSFNLLVFCLILALLINIFVISIWGQKKRWILRYIFILVNAKQRLSVLAGYLYGDKIWYLKKRNLKNSFFKIDYSYGSDWLLRSRIFSCRIGLLEELFAKPLKHFPFCLPVLFGWMQDWWMLKKSAQVQPNLDCCNWCCYIKGSSIY